VLSDKQNQAYGHHAARQAERGDDERNQCLISVCLRKQAFGKPGYLLHSQVCVRGDTSPRSTGSVRRLFGMSSFALGDRRSDFWTVFCERPTTYNTRNSIPTGMLSALQTAGYLRPLAWFSWTANQAKSAKPAQHDSAARASRACSRRCSQTRLNNPLHGLP
jgi:hypothetical protein